VPTSTDADDHSCPERPSHGSRGEHQTRRSCRKLARQNTPRFMPICIHRLRGALRQQWHLWRCSNSTACRAHRRQQRTGTFGRQIATASTRFGHRSGNRVERRDTFRICYKERIQGRSRRVTGVAKSLRRAILSCAPLLRVRPGSGEAGRKARDRSFSASRAAIRPTCTAKRRRPRSIKVRSDCPLRLAYSANLRAKTRCARPHSDTSHDKTS